MGTPDAQTIAGTAGLVSLLVIMAMLLASVWLAERGDDEDDQGGDYQ